MSFFDTILELLFPSRCLSCGKPGTELCRECLCSCSEDMRDLPQAWIFSLFDYRDKRIKRALWLLKYKGRRKLARLFACAIYDRMLEEMSELQLLKKFADPVLIPIPASYARKRERGFNQAELICREIIKIDNIRKGISFMELKTNILIKIKDTKRQALIKNKGERKKNIAGSFGITDASLAWRKNIILIDDISTTGATLKEARRTLLEAGARKVIAFTIAH